MTVDPCASGHPSTTDGFCDVCGKRVTDAAAASPPTAAATTPSTETGGTGVTAGGGAACPNCSAPMTGAGRFCEACGYDTRTGKVPQAAPAVALPTPTASAGLWTATVTADREFFNANDFGDVEFPSQYPPRQFTLAGPQMRIGRTSVSTGIHPEIDLSAAPLDPGISHSHALLTLNTTGEWLLSDLGSTNGTFVNDNPDPVTVGTMVELHDGDRIHLGAWTTITVHAPAPTR